MDVNITITSKLIGSANLWLLYQLKKCGQITPPSHHTSWWLTLLCNDIHSYMREHGTSCVYHIMWLCCCGYARGAFECEVGCGTLHRSEHRPHMACNATTLSWVGLQNPHK